MRNSKLLMGKLKMGALEIGHKRLTLKNLGVRFTFAFLILISLFGSASAALTVSPSSANINQNLTITSDVSVTWSIVTGTSGIDFSTPSTTTTSLSTNIFKHGTFSFMGTTSGGNSSTATVTIAEPKATPTLTSMVQTGQGILPNSQVTEVAKIVIEASGVLSSSMAGSNVLYFKDVEVKINTPSLVSRVSLYALKYDSTSTDDSFKFDDKAKVDTKRFTLVDSIASPTATVVLSGNGRGNAGPGYTGANLIYMPNDKSGFAKTYFVAISSSNLLLSGNTIEVTVSSNSNLPLTNFLDFKGTGSSITNTDIKDKSTFKMNFRVLNLVNKTGRRGGDLLTFEKSNTWPVKGAFPNTDTWPKKDSYEQGADIQSWVGNRFAPQWPEIAPGVDGTGPISSTGFPLLGTSSQLPVYAIVATGGTNTNPAKISEVTMACFTQNWLDANGYNGMGNLLKAGTSMPEKFRGFAVYKDDGDGMFDPDKDTPMGSAAVSSNVRTSMTLQGLNPRYAFNIRTSGWYVGYPSDLNNSLFEGTLNSWILDTDFDSTTNRTAAEYVLGGGNTVDAKFQLPCTLDPVEVTKSTYFVVLRATTNVDDGDSLVNTNSQMIPVGAAIHTFMSNIVVLPTNEHSSNVQMGWQTIELTEREDSWRASAALVPPVSFQKQGNFTQTVATFYNIAMVGAMPVSEIFPFDAANQYATFNQTRIIPHNLTPEPIFGVDLMSTDDATAKNATEIINGVTTKYLYRFSGLRVQVSGNTSMDRLANLSGDMLSGASLWKDGLKSGRKGYWDTVVDLIIDEDGTTTNGAGLKDYSLEDFANRFSASYKPYSSIRTNLLKFKVDDKVYFEDADLSGDYTLGESLFLDVNLTGQYESSAEINKIIYNKQKINRKNSSSTGFLGSRAISASKSFILRYSDTDNSASYTQGDVIIWDHDRDNRFTAPREVWVRPAEAKWEERTISITPGIGLSGNLTVTIAASVWDPNKWRGATVEFDDNSLYKITSNTDSTFSCNFLSGANTATGKTKFWILQADIVADVGQDVYDNNFHGTLNESTTAPYDGAYMGYDYYMAIRPMFHNKSEAVGGDGHQIQMTVSANGLLLDPNNSFSRNPAITVVSTISPPTAIDQAHPADQKIGVFSGTSRPMPMLAIDLVSGNLTNSSAVAPKYEDVLHAINIELYNRGGFAYQADFAGLSLSDNAAVGAYSGVSLWQDRNDITSTVSLGISSVSDQLQVDFSSVGNLTAAVLSNQLDPNGQKIEYLTLTSSSGTEEIVGYTDSANINGKILFMGLTRGLFGTIPSSSSIGSKVTAGRNGQFDESVDRNIPLHSSPYASGDAGTPTMLKMDVKHSPREWLISDNNLGDHAGPDLFVCIRTTERISHGDVFALSLVQWASTATGPVSATFKDPYKANTSGTGLFTGSTLGATTSYFGHGKTQDITVDSLAPSPVTQLTANRNDGIVEISWTASTDTDSLGTLLVRRKPSPTTLMPQAAVSYFSGSFLKSLVVYDNATVTANSNLLNLAVGNISYTNPNYGGIPDVAVGQYVVIRSGVNRGSYVINARNLDVAGTGTITINKKLQLDSNMSLEIGDGLVIMAGTDRTFTDSNLDNGSSYAYDAYAYDSVYNYSQSQTITFTPSSSTSTVPSSVTGAYAVNGNGAVQINWTNPNQHGLKYMVTVSSSSPDFTAVNGWNYLNGEVVAPGVRVLDLADITAGAAVNLSASSLTNGLTYYFHVFTRDAYMSYSPKVTITANPISDSVAPGDVVNLVQARSGNITTLTWVAPSSSDLDGYLILSSNVSSDLDSGSLLTQGKVYTKGSNAEIGASNVMQIISNKATVTISEETASPHFYRVYAYDKRPNYSLGIKPQFLKPTLTLSDHSLSGNLQLKLSSSNVEVDMALWSMKVVDDGLYLTSANILYPAGLTGTLSSNVSAVTVYSVVAGTNTWVGSNTTLYPGINSVLVPISNTGGSNFFTARSENYLFRTTFTIKPTAIAGDNFMMSEVTLTGSGNQSETVVSANLLINKASEMRLGVGAIDVKRGLDNGPDMFVNKSGNLLNLVATSSAFEDNRVNSLSFFVSPDLKAATSNILVDGVMNVNFTGNVTKTGSGNLFFDVVGGYRIAATTSANFSLVGIPNGNVGITATASFNQLVFTGITTVASNLLAKGSASDNILLKGDGLTLSGFEPKPDAIHTPLASGNYILSDFRVTGGGNALLQLSDLTWTMNYRAGFLQAYIANSDNIYFYRDDNDDGKLSASDNLIKKVTIADDTANRRYTLSLSGLTGANVGFDDGTKTFPKTDHRYILVAKFASNVPSGQSVAVKLASLSGNVLSLSGSTIVYQGEAKPVVGLDLATTSTVNFETGTLSVGTSVFTAVSANILSSSSNLTTLEWSLTASGENIQISKMTFEDLQTSNILGEVKFELVSLDGNVLIWGTNNNSELVFDTLAANIVNSSSNLFKLKMHFNADGKKVNLTDKSVEMKLTSISYKGIQSDEPKVLAPALTGHKLTAKASKVNSIVVSSSTNSVFPSSKGIDLMSLAVKVDTAVLGDRLQLDGLTIGVASGDFVTYVDTCILTMKSSAGTTIFEKVAKAVTGSNVIFTAANMLSSDNINLLSGETYTLTVSGNLANLGSGNSFKPKLLDLTASSNASYYTYSASSKYSAIALTAGTVSFVDASGSLYGPTPASVSVFASGTGKVHSVVISDVTQSLASGSSTNVLLTGVKYSFLNEAGTALDISSNVASYKLSLKNTTSDKSSLLTEKNIISSGTSSIEKLDMTNDLSIDGRELNLEFTMKQGIAAFTGRVRLDVVTLKITDNSSSQSWNLFLASGKSTTLSLSAMSVSHNGKSDPSFAKDLYNSGNVFVLAVNGSAGTPTWRVVPSTNVRLSASNGTTTSLIVDSLYHSGTATVTMVGKNVGGIEQTIITDFVITGATPLIVTNASGNVYRVTGGGFSNADSSGNLAWSLTPTLPGGAVLSNLTGISANVDKTGKSGVYSLLTTYNTPYLAGVSTTTIISHVGAVPSVTFTRPTESTLELRFSDIKDDGTYPYYFVYAYIDGVVQDKENPIKIVQRSTLVFAKPRSASDSSVGSTTITLNSSDLKGNLSTGKSIAFVIVGATSNIPSNATLSLPHSQFSSPTPKPIGNSEDYIAPAPGSSATFSGGGGGGCLLSK